MGRRVGCSRRIKLDHWNAVLISASLAPLHIGRMPEDGTEARNQVAKLMTPAQIAEAQRVASEWTRSKAASHPGKPAPGPAPACSAAEGCSSGMTLA
jgi:hypothetical protein